MSILKLSDAQVIALEPPKPEPPIVWQTTEDIFAPLPPTKWLVPGLQLCPGRPAMLAAYGSSAKTLSLQSLALAVASGTPAWGFFPTQKGQVRHLDYEQGKHATNLRYQRLALGHGITQEELGGRLQAAVFPRVYLDSPEAPDVYAGFCEGVDLVILDALRGATPAHDENDSTIRACIDNLTRVSEKTGCAFLMIHHAGKPKDGHSDARTQPRGSSAIFDACGSVFIVSPGKTSSDPRKWHHAKPPAEARGGAVEDFSLVVEDITIGTDPVAGVRVLHRAIEDEKDDPVARGESKYQFDAQALLKVIAANPGSTSNAIASKVSMRKARALDMLNALEEEGKVVAIKGENRSVTYRVQVRQ